jgi:hypothetical protein
VEQLRRDDRADEVEDGGQTDGEARRQRPRPDRCAYCIRRVVEAVGEVEEERDVCASGILCRDAL